MTFKGAKEKHNKIKEGLVSSQRSRSGAVDVKLVSWPHFPRLQVLVDGAQPTTTYVL